MTTSVEMMSKEGLETPRFFSRSAATAEEEREMLQEFAVVDANRPAVQGMRREAVMRLFRKAAEEGVDSVVEAAPRATANALVRPVVLVR